MFSFCCAAMVNCFFCPCFTPGGIARGGDIVSIVKICTGMFFIVFSYTAWLIVNFFPSVMRKQAFIFFHKAWDTGGSNSMPTTTTSLHCHSLGMAQTHVNCCLIVVFPLVSLANFFSYFSSYSQVGCSFCFLLHHAGW